ncbi:ribose-5-phosphate isomerase RpiA [Roseibium polysiphoniae]|uniref:Ribose-5-phosphate isomerase A n=1 Tax=Roseibium polysiphoniae TaxID=2571221 RepID=A0ABR9C618_9HYPH|nr:ribose-5-phosphate isomerase RpiA [Roseibium polysiphoniae]MBD8875192.1 ribose-5-phosphate isomerase RpiA [Roseibium polysiphoniae]
MSDEWKRLAAERAVEDVMPGMKLGIGTGSTAEHFVKALGARVRDGLDVIGVPTSERTRELALSEGIQLTTLEAEPQLDLTVDGADELDPSLVLIKGGGGALLREKIVAAASKRMIVIADASKVVDVLGAFALPIEVMPFGLAATWNAIEAALAENGLSGDLVLRGGKDHPFVTDGGHYIIDAALGRIEHPACLAEDLAAIPGVVEHGLFIGLADKAYVAGADGVLVVEATAQDAEN